MQGQFHLKSNTAKNVALYVDFKDGKFVPPDECITQEMADETATLNREFLERNRSAVGLLKRWETDPESASKEIKDMENRLRELESVELPELRNSFHTLLRRMLDEKLRKGG